MTETMFQFKSAYSEEVDTLYIQRKRYHSGNVCLNLIDAKDHFPYMCATVNVEGLSEDEVAIKNYSENEGILDTLVTEGVIKPPHRHIKSGFVIIPICKLC
jgi:hypothetical protein